MNNKSTENFDPSVEELNDFIKTAKPQMWMVLVAVLLILVGAIVWSFFGVLEVRNSKGKIEYIRPVDFVISNYE
ncbi:MAG TPA: hypothetical protein DCG28_02755 [Lachnospiraceae bacterium]|nr:hypothetical protein [Lachnospiraceae bacterium]